MAVLFWKLWPKLIDNLINCLCPWLSLKRFNTIKCSVFITLVPIWQSDFLTSFCLYNPGNRLKWDPSLGLKLAEEIQVTALWNGLWAMNKMGFVWSLSALPVTTRSTRTTSYIMLWFWVENKLLSAFYRTSILKCDGSLYIFFAFVHTFFLFGTTSWLLLILSFSFFKFFFNKFLFPSMFIVKLLTLASWNLHHMIFLN